MRSSTPEEPAQGKDQSVHTQEVSPIQGPAAKEFNRALACAQKAAARGNLELATAWCRYGARVAWWLCPGFFQSPEMEQLLGEIGRKSAMPAMPPTASMGAPTRFLHLMTQAYETGGHTRAVSRWIEICAQYAPSEHHSILISKQGDDPLPGWLAHSAQSTGGDIFRLPPMPSWLQMAAEVRSKSSEFDVIVLHVHPDDPLPNLAFYDRPRPVIFFNHADHAFTLGMDVAGIVADIRKAGHDLSSSLRAARPHKVLLPIPLTDGPKSSTGKAEARRKLGLPTNAPIALTIGDLFRFKPGMGLSFPAALKAICAQDPRVLVIAVGFSASESGELSELNQSTAGRFQSVGVVVDPEILELYYSAADVYLDCFPYGSLTSVLDAALHALPVQRLKIPDLPILWSDDLALDAVAAGASCTTDYVAEVVQWLQWPGTKRAEFGARFRAAVLQEHCGVSWKARWLDPAVKALQASGEAPSHPGLDRIDEKPDRFRISTMFYLAGLPLSMFVAAVILGMEDVPQRIRVSAVWVSVKPLLLDPAHDGMPWKRLLAFKELIKTCLPKRVITAVGRILRSNQNKL